MADRLQLNLRLDGRQELLDTIKTIATAQGISVNAWVVKTLELAASQPEESSEKTDPHSASPNSNLPLDKQLDTLLDNKLASKLAAIEERLGKLSA